MKFSDDIEPPNVAAVLGLITFKVPPVSYYWDSNSLKRLDV